MALAETSAEDMTRFPKVRSNGAIGITEISEGCNGSCSYCCVRLAKGGLRCFPAQDVVRDVEDG